jgi:hypothetical protein
MHLIALFLNASIHTKNIFLPFLCVQKAAAYVLVVCSFFPKFFFIIFLLLLLGTQTKQQHRVLRVK